MTERIPGKFERLAAERHARDLAESLKPDGHPRGLVFDLEAGERVVRFLEDFCKHHKGEWAGKPLHLEEWQRDVVRQAFGWKLADGTRRYRTVYLEEPRKNGKSEIAAGLGLYLLVADDEPGAEVYSSATKTEQARIVWETAAAMVRKSPDLKRFVKTFQSSLTCERVGSKFKPLGADSKTLDGLNPHGNIIDELHAHPDRRVWDVLDTAMGARRQPMTIAITTAGNHEPETIGWQMHDLAKKVLEGVIDDDSFFAVIYAADAPPESLVTAAKANPGGPEADQLANWYFTEEIHRQANPNFGVSVKPEFLALQARKARNQPGFLNEYLRLHLNVWTTTATRWLSLEDWNACEMAPSLDARAEATAREITLEGRPCHGGIDLASKLDLCAAVLVFPAPDGFLDVICRFWLPEATIAANTKKGLRHYETWQREGWLTATPGNVIDHAWIRKEVNALAKRFAVQTIGFDPHGAVQLSVELGSDGIQMVEVRQGFLSLSPPSKELECKVIDRKIRHANNPILKFCAANAVTSTDAAGNIKPDKEAAADKIDGVIALVIALGRFITAPIEGDNPYADGGGFKQL